MPRKTWRLLWLWEGLWSRPVYSHTVFRGYAQQWRVGPVIVHRQLHWR